MRGVLLLVVCLTMKDALDLHCKRSCQDDGDRGGRWEEKEKACVCDYVRMPGLKINGVLEKSAPEPY